MIPARGNAGEPVYPVVTISARTSSGITLTGGVDGGETATVLSNGSVKVNATISYLQNGSAETSNGRVEVQSRGTTEDTSNTVARSGLSVRITAGSRTATSGTISVYQQRNRLIEHRNSSFRVDSLTCTPKAGSSTGTALPTQAGVYRIVTPIGSPIYLDIRVTGRGTTEYFHYTAVTIGGTYEDYTNAEVPQTDIINFSVTANRVSVPVTNKTFTATNIHTLDEKTYACSGSYQGTPFAVSIVQNPDSQVTSGVTPIVRIAGSANTLWAGGGTAEFVVTAYDEAGLRWQSDGSLVDGSEPVQTDRTDNIILMPVASSSDAYPLIQLISTDTTAHTKTYRVSHRDMTTNVTTDTLSVSASNGSAQTQTPLSYSAQNALLDTIYTVDDDTVIWGEETERDVSYRAAIAIRRAGGTADPTLFTRDYPALFIGDSAEYIASAAHTHQVIQRGAARRYSYKHYSSWSSAHDDDSHRLLVGTEEINPQTRLISDETVSDTVSVTVNVPWITLSTANGTITLAAQPEEGRVRYGNLVATNTSDPASTQASATREITQNAWANLTATPLVPPTFDCEGGSTEITITARYTMFTIASTGDWISLAIKPYLADDSQYETPSGSYGNTGGSQQYTLKVSATINDEDHNPTGYTHVRIAGVTLTPEYPGISTVRIRLEQEAYDGGLPTNE